MKRWYEGINPHSFGNGVAIEPGGLNIHVPVDENLKISVISREKLKFPKTNNLGFSNPLLNEENFLNFDGESYLFQTKYFPEESEVESLDKLNNLPRSIQKFYTRKASNDVKKLTEELVGKEIDTIEVLKTFYQFIKNNLRDTKKWEGKSVERMIKEYREMRCFYESCDGAVRFLSALCNARSIPNRAVYAHPYLISPWGGGHTWNEIAVPTVNSYGWIPVDCTERGYFNELSGNHLVTNSAPKLGFLTLLRVGYEYNVVIKIQCA